MSESKATYGAKYKPPETFQEMLDQGMMPGLDVEIMAGIREALRAASLTGRKALVTIKLTLRPTTLKESKLGQQLEIIHGVDTKLPKLDMPKGSAFVTPTLQLSLHPHRVEPLALEIPPRAATG